MIYFCIFMCITTLSLQASGPPDVIFIIIDQCSLKTLIDTPTKTLDNLKQIGAFGLMNVRTAGDLRPESTYLTAGNGKKCIGSNYTHTGEYNGKNIKNIFIEKIRNINRETNYKSDIGLLGKICRENNKTIAVYGNTDTVNKKRRIVVSLAMDEKGRVPSGEVSQKILTKSNLPWGYKTNWSVLESLIIQDLKDIDLLIIETGDMSRIADYSRQLEDYNYQYYQKEALKNIDKFISQIIQKINLKETLIAVASLTPAPGRIKGGEKLTWALLAGRGIKQGWLTTKTTRREGIITITDLLPTLISGLSLRDSILQKYSLSGSNLQTIPDYNDWEELLHLNNQIKKISSLRPLFIRLFVALQLIVIIMAISCMFYKKLYKIDFYQYIIEYLLLFLFLLPLNLLFISQIFYLTIWPYLLILIFFSVLEIYITEKIFRDCIDKFLIITLVVVLIIVVDLLNNAYLMADSILGYSSVIGARFYGLGNEYMGLFIGAAVMILTGMVELILHRKKSKYIWTLTAVGFLIITFFIGAPHLGANFGGTITALITFMVSWLYLQGFSLNIKSICILLIILIIIMGSIIYLDYSQLISSRTHIGRAIAPILKGDFREAKNIVIRKVEMNIKLMRWTIWTRAIIAFLFYLIILFKHPVGQLKKMFVKYPYLASGFYGCLAGSITTLFVNDSGVVASATLLFYPMLGLLYIFNKYVQRNNGKYYC